MSRRAQLCVHTSTATPIFTAGTTSDGLAEGWLISPKSAKRAKMMGSDARLTSANHNHPAHHVLMLRRTFEYTQLRKSRLEEAARSPAFVNGMPGTAIAGKARVPGSLRDQRWSSESKRTCHEDAQSRQRTHDPAYAAPADMEMRASGK
ncbi:hypothetical protein PMIN03_004831 [Paraphaeosphaeria minitans]|uniref:Uncharacterized protein n=1 Tax=Paraphaeosphaeria minitans TaxID=565426 RepID=A0A9P6KR17_9PLEO|nr:hypothetical protein PMIN01_06791 [Paraphaeosphaeria minitans]